MWPHDPTSAETQARCDRILAANPSDVLALVHRGQVSPLLRAEALAEADLNRAIDLEPRNPALYYIRGVTLNRASDLEEAIGLLLKGGEIGGKAICTSEPDIVRWEGSDDAELLYMAFRGLGGVLEEQGRIDEALVAFERAASFQVIAQADLERWTESEMQVGRLSEAVVGWQKLIQVEARANYHRRLEECLRWLRVPRSVCRECRP